MNAGGGGTDGWYADPVRRWPERYYLGGQPTGHVRSGSVSGYDPMPTHGPAPALGGVGSSPQTPVVGPLKTGPLPLHPMTLGDIVDGAFHLYRANFRTIVIIAAVIAAPVDLVTALIERNEVSNAGYLNLFSNESTTGSRRVSTLTELILLVLGLLVIPIAGGAISRVVSASYLGDEVTPAQALKFAARWSGALLVAWFFSHLLEFAGFAFIVLPGLIFEALNVCIAPAIVIEGLGPFKGIGRSWHLNRDRMWRVMGVALLSGLMVSFIGVMLEEPLRLIAGAVGPGYGWILIFLSGLVGSMSIVSLTAIIATLIYFDGRIRSEGFDLQILARGLGR